MENIEKYVKEHDEMTDKKLTDEDIISSLKVIATTKNCDECKIRNSKWGTCNCSQTTAEAALKLMDPKRQRLRGCRKRLTWSLYNFKIYKSDKKSHRRKLRGCKQSYLKKKTQCR